MKYYLGLDIGTDSVGYAVTDEYYMPLKKKGEPMMGITTFEAANTAAERRGYRTARRRIDRKQQRVQLVNEIFAPSISKVDPKFFIRRNESRLFRDEAGEPFTVFNDKNFTDKDYHKIYPTIHHLIVDLMQSEEKHDVRLVYLAVAWLVAHRGHFLFDVAPDKAAELLNFDVVYNNFCDYFEENEYKLPWSKSVTADDICEILLMHAGVGKKKEAFKQKVFGGKKPAKDKTDECPFGAEAISALLSGAKVKPEDVFQNGEYTEVESLSLTMGDEDFARIVAELGEDGELLRRMRALQDCALLLTAKNNKDTISEAQVAVYDLHKKDLALLKRIIKKYKRSKYDEIFRKAGKANYTAYSYNTKGCEKADVKKAGEEDFNAYIKGIIKDITPDKTDKADFEDMKARVELGTFMPKQKNTDNRVVPQQLYRVELQKILDNAEKYLGWFSSKDESGLTAKQKLLSIFDFRIPYFVGPLTNKNSDHAWIARKADGKIYPWNFNELVDLDESEERFIRRMTNKCTYVAGADVLPAKSLLYCRYTVLNEINNLKVDGMPLPVDVKQEIYNNVMLRNSRVSLKTIKDYLVSHGKISKTAELTGADTKLNATLSSYHKFRKLLESGTLSESDVEDIICRAAYSEDKGRFIKWLAEKYPQITKEDRRYVAGLDLKNFGRLSKELLTEVPGCESATGEYFGSIIEALWNTNNNLMQLLSDRFSFRENIEQLNREYYQTHAKSLADRLDEMYISNAVKRPILRTMDICGDVVKAMGCAPEKIFVEMARDASGEQRGKRTVTRKQQLLDLYKRIKTDEARQLEKELAAMGEMADNRLQSERLFLYYLQMGKCAYSGVPIDLTRLSDGTYNVDHIYPQAFVKDDSILNNKVLVCSKINGDKKDVYPLDSSIQSKMRKTWEAWKHSELMSEEKYRRLTRMTPFTEEEKWGFINRQLVETRQSTKAVASLMQEKYPETAVVYVKAGLVSEFRQEFDMLKSRAVNDLHHAKDAYLNIVVGNVYDSRFSKRWFDTKQNYSIKTRTLFTHPVKCGKAVVWQGETDIAKVRSVMQKNHIHVTRYAFMRKGGLFDQQPVKAAPGLVPLKKDLPTERYGGYNKPTASFYYLAAYTDGKKREVMFVPVELMVSGRCLNDRTYAEQYVKTAIESIIGKSVAETEILLNGRVIKIGTVIEADGLRMIINGKSNGGKQMVVGVASPLILSSEQEKYMKRLERFTEKQNENASIIADAEHDHITLDENKAVYESLSLKMNETLFAKMPGNQGTVLKEGIEKFVKLSVNQQTKCILSIISLFGKAQTADLTLIGGSKQSGAKFQSAKLSNWSKNYTSVYIIDQSASGIFEKRSENLLDLL